MDQTEAGSPPEQKYLTVRQAAFIGVGAISHDMPLPHSAQSLPLVISGS